MSDDVLIVFFVILAIAVVGGILVSWGWESTHLWGTYNAEAHFLVGRYLVGLDDVDGSVDSVRCVVAPEDFVFLPAMGVAELGRIPRAAVEEVVIDDRSQITQRLTATRMVALGVFALAAPKRRKIREWCVGIRWLDGKGIRRSTLFEFTGSNPEGEANEAATNLMRFVSRPEADALALDSNSGTKVCPYCAETIKAAAIICRFCDRELPKQLADS